MYLMTEDLVKILLAVLAGGLVGVEREFRDKAAGFRTLIFICVGAALFTILSADLAGDKDPTRIAAQVVSGVGFLGAGVILRDQGRVIGLTTAATIWGTAALGMGFGGGHYALSFAALAVVLVVLWIFPWIERAVEQASETRVYTVSCALRPEKLDEVEALFRGQGLRATLRERAKLGETLFAQWEVRGAPRRHAQMAQLLFADLEIKEFRLLEHVAS